MGTMLRRRGLFSIALVLLLLLAAAGSCAAAARLSPNYYRRSCPRVERIVADVIAAKQRANPSTAAGTLRLFFHDCFVNGCDASVLVSPLSSDSSPERAAEINLSLPGDAFDAVDRAKAALEAACPGTVSCADILALAARDLVGILGGPRFPVALGRRDSLRSDARDVEGNLPRTNMSARAMVRLFASKGLSPREMVALAGAHTVGFSHCAEFAHRLYGFKSADGYDPRLNPEFALALQRSCAGYRSDPTVSIFNDVVTPRDFDEAYYKNLPHGLGLLASDAALWEYPPTRVFVQRYAGNRTAFFEDFAAAMQRLGSVGVKTGWQGGVRRRCDALD
ncbi:peroxidase 31-like [Phragmites australis]|uniref:peroxidase 31-like n=1 Tax=Phragmites australis TaxID=29695 RepID=UPI002D78BC49|nr:peroxidase 31-like [Phragmites australis]